MTNVFRTMFEDPMEVVKVILTNNDKEVLVYRESDTLPRMKQEEYNLVVNVTNHFFDGDVDPVVKNANINLKYIDTSLKNADLIISHWNQRTAKMDGFCTVVRKHTDKDPPFLYISLIVTQEKVSMNGLGIAMIRFVEYLRDQLGYATLRLSPVDVDSVKAWYTFLGFKPDNTYNRIHIIPTPEYIYRDKIRYRADYNKEDLMWYINTAPFSQRLKRDKWDDDQSDDVPRTRRRTGRTQTSALPYFVKLDKGETPQSFYQKVKNDPHVEYQGVVRGTRTAMLMAESLPDTYRPIYPDDDLPSELHAMFRKQCLDDM